MVYTPMPPFPLSIWTHQPPYCLTRKAFLSSDHFAVSGGVVEGRGSEGRFLFAVRREYFSFELDFEVVFPDDGRRQEAVVDVEAESVGGQRQRNEKRRIEFEPLELTVSLDVYRFPSLVANQLEEEEEEVFIATANGRYLHRDQIIM